MEVIELAEGDFVEVNEFGHTEKQSKEIALRVDASHVLDYDGRRRIYADSVSRSEVLVKRARAASNGH